MKNIFLQDFINCVILNIEKGKAKEAAYSRILTHQPFIRSAVIIASNGGYFLLLLKIV